MDVEIGRIQAIYRYPVKSMAGESLERAPLGWHGLEGDRRLAFRRLAEQGGFPWLTASRLPSLILYQPLRAEGEGPDALPGQVRTPDGRRLDLRSEALRDDIARHFGGPVDLMYLKQGIFDEAPVSLISLATGQHIAAASGVTPDLRRFRPNLVIDTQGAAPFAEDQWLGKTIVFGDAADAPALHISQQDPRCVMINLHPDSAESDPAVLKSVVQLNQNCAGVYATVIRPGALALGQAVTLRG